jgi:cobalt-precorrin-5B (C1)-methyltransferase
VKHPVERLTIGGGIGKMTKLAQGARDLHSGRSQVDFTALGAILSRPDIVQANTALQAYEIVGTEMADWVAKNALIEICKMLPPTIDVDTVIIDRAGTILARAGT